MHDNPPDDPRMSGFNYSTGWGSAPKPPLYLTALKKSRELNALAKQAADAAWELDHALWVVRIASTGQEKAIALNHLAEKMQRFHNQVEAA